MERKNQEELIADLSQAIETLHQVLSAHYPHLPTLRHLSVSKGALLPLRSFPYKERTKRKEEIKQILFHAIETLKKQYAIIQRKLSSGTSKEKAWAKEALDTIDLYNALLTKHALQKAPLLDRLFGFVIFQEDLLSNVIEIPSDIFLRFDSIHEDTSLGDHIWEKIADALKSGKLVDYSKTERDMFYMRAISLAKKAELPEELTKDLSLLMRKTPITATQDEKQESVVSMMQVLNPFPGETITVEGRFKRNPSALVASVPEPSSFRVLTVVKQSGFPHPSQYTGWALSNCFLPENPLRIDHTPQFHTIHKIKKQIALDLLPGGRLNKKAKEILSYKREVFKLHHKELIPLHARLMKALVKNPQHEKTIDRFFSFVDSHTDSFDYLSTTHHLINRHFADDLHAKLFKQWQEGIQISDHKERYHFAYDILMHEISLQKKEFQKQFELPHTELEKATWEYILLMGNFVGERAAKLLLHYFSETIGYSPPLLTSEDLTLIALSLRQIESFEEELERPLPEHSKDAIQLLYKNLLTTLQTDIAILEEGEEKEPPETAIAEELERYYNARYSYLRHSFKKQNQN